MGSVVPRRKFLRLMISSSPPFLFLALKDALGLRPCLPNLSAESKAWYRTQTLTGILSRAPVTTGSLRNGGSIAPIRGRRTFKQICDGTRWNGASHSIGQITPCLMTIRGIEQFTVLSPEGTRLR